MIRCHNLAVCCSADNEVTFRSRYPGDAEAGVLETLPETFRHDNSMARKFFRVRTLHPHKLSLAHISKIDVEGAEAEIVRFANFSAAALLLIEYQYSRSLESMKAHLATEFEPIVERQFPWADMLSNRGYQRSLKGDHYALLFLLRRGQTGGRRKAFRRLVEGLLPPALLLLLRKVRQGLRWWSSTTRALVTNRGIVHVESRALQTPLQASESAELVTEIVFLPDVNAVAL